MSIYILTLERVEQTRVRVRADSRRDAVKLALMEEGEEVGKDVLPTKVAHIEEKLASDEVSTA